MGFRLFLFLNPLCDFVLKTCFYYPKILWVRVPCVSQLVPCSVVVTELEGTLARLPSSLFYACRRVQELEVVG